MAVAPGSRAAIGAAPAAPFDAVPAVHGLRCVAEARDVFKIYREHQVETVALRGVDLCIQPGDFVALIGPSGSGKSTLLNLLGGIDTPSAGQVCVTGLDIGQLPEAQRALRLLQAVGVGQLADSLPDQLSGGERQRVGIARALANNPRLILADEPTGSLDRTAGQAVINLLKQVARQHQATVILATHDAEVADAADRVLVLRDGRLEQ